MQSPTVTLTVPSSVPPDVPRGREEEPLPACEARTARAPVPFVRGGSAGIQLLPAGDRALADVQGALEAWVRALGEHSDGTCHLKRNDGELLSFVCSSWYFTGNGGVRGGPEESFTFTRGAAGTWQRLSLAQMLPGAGGDPRKDLDRMCEQRGSSVRPSALDPVAPSDDAPWLNVVEPASTGLHLQVGWGADSSAHCVIEYPALKRLAGCGALAPLGRPDLLAAPASNDGAAALALVRVDVDRDGDWHFPVWSSRDPRHASTVAVLNDEIRAWRASAGASEPFNLECDATMSTHALVSVICTADEGKDGPEASGLTFRLASAARIGPSDLFANRPAAVRTAIKRCLGEHVRKPKDDYDETLDALPSWSSAQFAAFALEEASVRFVVGFRPKTRKGEVRARTTTCSLRYEELKISPDLLAQPRARPPP